MKYTKTCPKCQNQEIAIIEGGTFKGNMYNTISSGLHTFYLTRYVCTYCGYTENYLDDVNDLQKIKNKFITPNSDDGFV
jgi:predicted nucleic-acid-binding Zn-ribbon protein